VESAPNKATGSPNAPLQPDPLPPVVDVDADVDVDVDVDVDAVAPSVLLVV
jgi:hypothetical protein